jgi:protein-serine/threonine kinase
VLYHHHIPSIISLPIAINMNEQRSGPSSLNVNVNAAQNYSRSRPPSPTSPLYQTSPKPRGEDYVYFERKPQDNFTSDAVARATAAKLKLESYYKMVVDTAIERNAR